MRRQKVKQESAATTSHHREEEHDLAYYIHDRVELMHQVFSVIKPKELKAMAPSCVQLISIDNLKELCTEELLGISSKRLCAILDGAEPPTDTESSSSEQLETISLDSISSDDDILSQPESKRKHKHRKKNKAKNKHKHKHSSESEEDKDNKEQSKASRAGLTVLELLELQARARAIRAQLQKDNASKLEGSTEQEDKEHSSDEVEIKEEPPEVFEISSDEEKPKLEELEKLLQKPSTDTEKTSEKRIVTKTITKVVNDLTITVPTKPTHKIRLNRNRSVKTSTNEVKEVNERAKDKAIDTEATTKIHKGKKDPKDITKKKKKKNKNKDGSDHDEITLQLSDTEKMDLLEDLDNKNFENFTSSEDSESSSSENETEKIRIAKSKNDDVINDTHKITICKQKKVTEVNDINQCPEKDSNENNKEININIAVAKISSQQSDNTEDNKKETTLTDSDTLETIKKNHKITESEDIPNTSNEQIEDGEIKSNKDLSEGEISDKDTIKESEKQIVCISDDDKIMHKKKLKKDKKFKKEKKKTKSVFHESNDQNFFTDNNAKAGHNPKDEKLIENPNRLSIDDNLDTNICEVLELSDSDYEIDIIVSQEPTADEIKALSAKIDEIDPNEQTDNIGEVESWRDRYLDSKKVKKVLTTANLLNALRKKNKELKNKLQGTPQVEKTKETRKESDTRIEGTIEQFNTLQGSTKYVNPVVEEKKKDEEVTKEMKKDAKQLLKMYKMLLKYNDINKHKDPNRKKKKKQKKSKERKDVVDNNCAVTK